MAKRKTVSLNTHQLDAIEKMQEHGEADSQSEAFRMALNVGFVELGYLNGHSKDTSLRRLVREVGKLSTYAAIFALGMSLFYPFAFRVPVLILIVGGMVCFSVDKALARVEPRVSDNIKRFVEVEKT